MIVTRKQAQCNKALAAAKKERKEKISFFGIMLTVSIIAILSPVIADVIARAF